MNVDGIQEVEAPELPLGAALASLEVDLSIYSLRAVRRAAYKLTDRCHIFLSPAADPGRLLVRIAAKDGRQDLGTLIGELCNDMLDQQIREELENEAGALRDLIVAQAFAEGNLLDPRRDEGDYQEDPLGIGHPDRREAV